MIVTSLPCADNLDDLVASGFVVPIFRVYDIPDVIHYSPSNENLTPPETHYRPVKEEEMGEFPNVTVRFLPRPCMQCENSPCTKVCPVKATYHRPDGIIAMDYEKCIGCKYCTYFLGLCYHFLASSAPPGPVGDADLVGMGGFLGKSVRHEE